jgi:hypothetical protein
MYIYVFTTKMFINRAKLIQFITKNDIFLNIVENKKMNFNFLQV